MHVFPPIRNTGVKVRHISDDWLHWEFELPLGMKTRNYVGTHYGGTLYSAADPHFMLAWMHILPDHIVWDKAASIRFLRPGKGTLYAGFSLDQDEVEEIRRLTRQGKVDRVYQWQWRDGDDNVVCEVEKTLHFRRK